MKTLKQIYKETLAEIYEKHKIVIGDLNPKWQSQSNAYDDATYDESQYSDLPSIITTNEVINNNPAVVGANQDEVNVNLTNKIKGKADISEFAYVIHKSEKGTPNGVTPLGADGKVAPIYLPSSSGGMTFDSSNNVRMMVKGTFYTFTMPKTLGNYTRWEMWCNINDTANVSYLVRTLIAGPVGSSSAQIRDIASFATNRYDGNSAGTYVTILFETRGLSNFTSTNSFTVAYQSSSANSIPATGSYQGLYVGFRGWL